MSFSYMRSKLLYLKHNLSSSSTTMSGLELVSPKHGISPFRRFSTMKVMPYFRGHRHTVKSVLWLKLVRNLSLLCPLLMNNVACSAHSTALARLPAVLIRAKGPKIWPYIAALITISFLRVERVPYSRKFHFSFRLPDVLNPLIAEYETEKLEQTYGDSILPPSHPKSIKAMSMVREIAQAMHNGLGLKKDCTVRTFRPGPNDSPILGDPLLVGKSRDLSKLRDRKVMKFGKRCSTRHLEGREWKVILVDSDEDNASMFPDGTMVIYSDFLDTRSSNEKLAFTIGHEFGHAIARHSDISLLRAVLLTLVIYPLMSKRPAEQYHRVVTLTTRFFSRRDELEADHIGLMLMASAGYNPQAAPEFERDVGDESDLESTHPSSAERAESLEKPKKMRRAMEVYKEALSGRSTISLG